MLAECKLSVAAQTEPHDIYEHLVLVDRERRGCSWAMNQLAAQAHGEWLLPLADDDLILPRCLYSLLERSSEGDVIYSPPLVSRNGSQHFFGAPPEIPSLRAHPPGVVVRARGLRRVGEARGGSQAVEEGHGAGGDLRAGGGAAVGLQVPPGEQELPRGAGFVRIAVVTPWLNHLELADAYLEAVLPEAKVGDELLVVDNASDPPLDFAALRSESNLGFVGGCNLGLHGAHTDAVLFLNNDVELVRRGWFEEIRQALEPGVLVGPLRDDYHASVDGRSLPYIDGWCLAGMRDDLLALGGFDSDLEEPAYYSDNLLCLEARASGMTLRDLKPGLRHLENVTAGHSSTPSVMQASQWNRERYVARVRELLTPTSA